MTDTSVHVLFDSYHDNQITLDGRVGSPTSEGLRMALSEQNFVLEHGEGLLPSELLAEIQVLAILAPASPLHLEEIERIVNFVRRGGGLLLVSDFSIMWQKYHYSLNELTTRLGFVFREYFNTQPHSTNALEAHYLTTGVRSLGIDGACCIRTEPIEGASLLPIAWLSAWRTDILSACMELGRGRVVALSDTALFTEQQWATDDNKAFALNVFDWLARRNPIDLVDVKAPQEAVIGQPARIQIVLSNPVRSRLESVRAYLESPTGATVEPREIHVRSIPGPGVATLSWLVSAPSPAKHRFSLTVECDNAKTLFFDDLAKVRIVAPGRLVVAVTDLDRHQETEFETGQEFAVQAFFDQETEERYATQIQIELPESAKLVRKQEMPLATQWVVRADEPGTHRISCRFSGSHEDAQVNVHIRRSLDYQLEDLRRRFLQPLDAEIARRLCEIHPSLTDEQMRAVPFSILSPEDFARQLYPPEVADRLLEVIRSAQRETRFNPVLLSELLVNIAPLYSPREGGCVPADPGLASRWVTLHPEQREQIEYNFLQADDTDPDTVRQNLAAYLLHEKYGHGYFYIHTELGRQLGILYRHGFIRKVDSERLSAPYPQSIYFEYSEAIEALSHSAIIVNEGLAAWMELRTLERLAPELSRAFYRRQVYLLERTHRLTNLTNESKYFQIFRPLVDSPYQEGYERLRSVERWFGSSYGDKCALQVARKAADVSVGIEEVGTTIHFALSPSVMTQTLLDPLQPDHARADNRLRRITRVLFDSRHRIHSVQRQLECHRTCLHPECPVYGLISEKLGW